jgi:hypothetical protein
MIILTYCDGKYRDKALFCMSQAKKFGYSVVSYDLGGSGFGKKYVVPQEILNSSAITKFEYGAQLSKPYMLLEALKDVNETLVYMDADAFLVRSIDEIETDDYDVGVTYRGTEHGDCINSGVLFFRPNSNALRFVQMWADKTSSVWDRVGSLRNLEINDQKLLIELIYENIPREGYRTKIDLNEVKDIKGVRVKFFDYAIYNNYNLVRKSSVAPLSNDLKVAHLRNVGQLNFNNAVAAWGLDK